MNNYEEIFADTIDMFSPSGIWIRNNDLKIGFNYVEIEVVDDNVFDFNDEIDDVYTASDISIEDYFDEYEDLEFCFTLDKALQGNFITWKEFCERINSKKSFNDVISI